MPALLILQHARHDKRVPGSVAYSRCCPNPRSLSAALQQEQGAACATAGLHCRGRCRRCCSQALAATLFGTADLLQHPPPRGPKPGQLPRFLPEVNAAKLLLCILCQRPHLIRFGYIAGLALSAATHGSTHGINSNTTSGHPLDIHTHGRWLASMQPLRLLPLLWRHTDAEHTNTQQTILDRQCSAV